MNVRLSRRAFRDVKRIADYLHDRNPAAAGALEQELRDAFDMISVYPKAGRALEQNLRRLTLPRVPYLIFYRIDAVHNVVNIVTIRHAARRPEQFGSVRYRPT